MVMYNASPGLNRKNSPFFTISQDVYVNKFVLLQLEGAFLSDDRFFINARH